MSWALTMTSLSDIHQYYKIRIEEVQRFAKTFGSGDLWTFLMCSSFIDYLVKMVNNKDKTSGSDYKEFIRLYLSQINIKYIEFKYKSGKQDLPEQIYHVLRCGITHSHSLFPDKLSRVKGGRNRSIVLAHRKNGNIHLDRYLENGLDSVIFTIEDFSEDLEKVLDKIFIDVAPQNSEVASKILAWVTNYPPISNLSPSFPDE